MTRRQALITDIAGTNSRLAIADIDKLAVRYFAMFRGHDFGLIRRSVRTAPDCSQSSSPESLMDFLRASAYVPVVRAFGAPDGIGSCP